MTSLLKRVRPVLFAGAALLAFCLGAASAQSDANLIKSRGFLRTTRPPAVFNHDQHNEKAGLDDCAACHHGGQKLRQDKSDMTAGTPCFQCHQAERSDGGTRLQLAYHRQCLGCHDKTGRGPLACGACHVEPGRNG